MPTRLYLLSDSTLSPDLSGTAGSLTGSINDTAFGQVLQFEREVGADVEGTSFPTNIPVNGLSGTLEYRYRVQRVNSSGTVQASSAYSAVYSTAGTRTDTLSLRRQPGTFTWMQEQSLIDEFQALPDGKQILGSDLKIDRA